MGVVVVVISFVVAGFVFLAGGEDEGGHRLSVTVPSATDVLKGQYVRLNGVPVGKVADLDSAAGGKAARIVVELTDKAWPLPIGSKMELRWGGTVRFSDRYIALEPATASDEMLADGGTIPSKDFEIPAEFDELLATFREKDRRNLNAFLDESGEAMDVAGDDLRRTLEAAPPALEQASFVVRDLDAQREAVSTIVTRGSDLLAAVEASSPDIQALLDGAGTTFDAIGDRAAALRDSLEVAPRTLTTARDTLRRADSTLVAARELTRDLAPGVTEIRATAAPLDSVLGTLRYVGPDLASTLSTLRRAVPDLDPLLGRLRQEGPKLESIGDQSVSALECLRPYTPEIAGFVSSWASHTSGSDGKDRLFRAQIQNYGPAFTNAQPFTPAEAAGLFPGLRYAFPNPPGQLAGQPWFNEECGYGPDVLDPAKDPEARNTQPIPDQQEDGSSG